MIDAYLDELYDKTFSQEYEGLRWRKEHDPEFSPEALRRQLNGFYTAQGDDWLGRGDVGNITYDATIAAFESFCAAWEAELSAQEKIGNI